MNKIEICKKLEKIVVKVAVFDGKILKSTGTGVVIRKDGILLTANHVIENYKSLSDPKIVIVAKSNKEKALHLEYEPVFADVSLDMQMPQFLAPLEIDLAILRPKNKADFEFDFILLDDEIVPVGTDVIMAGFPDEVKLPLDFASKLDFSNKELKGKETDINQALSFFMALRMVKSGMVGAMHRITLNSKFNSKIINIKGASYWIDNVCTFGASGGAVVNSDCKLVGIMCQKAMTQFLPQIDIPSGSTMALSHKLITWFMSYC